jgi:hypothetical protein
MEKPHFIIPHVVPQNTLFERIVMAIYEKQERMRLWRVRVFAGTVVLSVAALIPIVASLISALHSSNFGAYFSLIFSDSGVFLSAWKDIGVSLAESLPAITMAATLALLGILLWSLRSMIRSMSQSSLQAV